MLDLSCSAIALPRDIWGVILYNVPSQDWPKVAQVSNAMAEIVRYFFKHFALGMIPVMKEGYEKLSKKAISLPESREITDFHFEFVGGCSKPTFWFIAGSELKLFDAITLEQKATHPLPPGVENSIFLKL